jgi:putative pyruvate formate lyase activating enzyme
MSDLTKLRIWDDPAIHNALSWYLDVAENRHPAKFRIAATVAAGLDPASESEDAPWAGLDRLTPLFLARDSNRRPAATASGWTKPPGAMLRARTPHARPLQFLPLELSR